MGLEVLELADGQTRLIDRATPIPFYYQLQEILKEEIERGTWQPGDELPSEAELEQHFGVSRTVVRKALDVLESDGQISRSKGKRSVVTRAKARWDARIGSAGPGGQDAPSKLVLGQVVAVRRAPAAGHVGGLLGIESSGPVFELTFTQELAGEPVALSQMYLNPAASRKLAAECGQEALPVLAEQGPDAIDQLASRYGLEIAVSEVTIELTHVNEFESALLKVPMASPAFLLSALDRDSAQAAVSFTRTVIQGSRFSFSMAIRHQAAAARGSGLVSYLTKELLTD